MKNLYWTTLTTIQHRIIHAQLDVGSPQLASQAEGQKALASPDSLAESTT